MQLSMHCLLEVSQESFRLNAAPQLLLFKILNTFQQMILFFSLESNSESVLGVHDGGQGCGVGAGVELVDLLSRNQDGVVRIQVVDLAPDVDLGMALDHPEERLTAFRVDRSWARAEAEDNDVGLVGLAEQPLGSGGHDL